MILDNNAQATNISAAYSWWGRLSASAPLRKIEGLIEELSELMDGRPMEPYMDERVFGWFSTERAIEVAQSDEASSKLRELYAETVALGWFPVYNLNAGTVAQKFSIGEYLSRYRKAHPDFQFSALLVTADQRLYAAS